MEPGVRGQSVPQVRLAGTVNSVFDRHGGCVVLSHAGGFRQDGKSNQDPSIERTVVSPDPANPALAGKPTHSAGGRACPGRYPRPVRLSS